MQHYDFCFIALEIYAKLYIKLLSGENRTLMLHQFPVQFMYKNCRFIVG